MQTNKNLIIVAVLSLVVGIIIGFVCRVDLSSVNQEGATIRSNQTDLGNPQEKINKCLDEWGNCFSACLNIYGVNSPLFSNCSDSCTSTLNACRIPYR